MTLPLHGAFSDVRGFSQERRWQLIRVCLPSTNPVHEADIALIRWPRFWAGQPYLATSTPDITARLVGQSLSNRFGQQFIIDNRPGAGTNIATEVVVRAPPDGYTLLWVTAPNAINATLYDKLNFNFIRDIAPVAPIVRASQHHRGESVGSSQDRP
jgi:hypothetical protein